MNAAASTLNRSAMLMRLPRSTATWHFLHLSRSMAFSASKLSATGIGTMKLRRE
jgi:hypothetical protein